MEISSSSTRFGEPSPGPHTPGNSAALASALAAQASPDRAGLAAGLVAALERPELADRWLEAARVAVGGRHEEQVALLSVFAWCQSIRARLAAAHEEISRLRTPDGSSSCDVTSLVEVERRHILAILERSGWRVRGRGGAAELVDMKPTTLESRMQKLGIRRPGRN